MIGSSKILTVSYGTFSCTLEGFEDSFSTMKAIAEYFRDLAADDRYFGAEPPTPDTEMLARIAEAQSRRRIEARTENGGITLRPALAEESVAADTRGRKTDTPAVAAATARTEPVDAAGDAVGSETAQLLADPEPAVFPSADADSDLVDEADGNDVPLTPRMAQAPAAASGDDDDSLAAKLRRIRAVVGQGSASAPAAFADADADSEAAPTARPAADPSDDDEMPVLARVVRMTRDAYKATAEVDVPSDSPAAGEDVGDAPVEAELSADEAAEADEPVALVAEEVTFSEAAEESAEDLPEVSFSAEEAEEDEAEASGPAVEDEEGFEDGDEAVHEAAHEDGDEDGDEAGLLMDLAEVEGDMADEDDLAIAAPLDEDDTEMSDGAAALLDRLTAGSEDDDADEDGTEDALQGIAAALLDAEDEAEDDLAEAGFDADDSADQDWSLTEVLAAADEDEDDATEGPFRLDASAQVAAGEMGDADESEVEAEVEVASEVEVEVEVESEVEAASGEDEDDEDEPAARGRALLHDEPDEEGVARLYSRADGELSTPEAGQRREALSQLKAAVLAAEAARELGEGRRDDVSESAFRDDLREVVRPRRPVLSGEGRSNRPRQAPLKLVASQRIDVPQEEPVARRFDSDPVRPRRVAVDETVHLANDDGGFAEFALSVGAHELPDLLEAAAAYTSFVEGMDDFSRPQLIAKVREAAEQSYSREDELRSFGTLLRQGRLSKVRNGRFQVAESTRFHPERQAG